jgi:hypothetical protein
MRVNLMNVAIGVGAGAVDEVMESQDARAGRTAPFKTWTDWSRIGLAAVGYLGQMFGYFSAYAEPLAQSEVTLVTKTVGAAIRSRMGTTAMVTRTSHGNMPAAPATATLSARRVGWRPLPVGV